MELVHGSINFFTSSYVNDFENHLVSFKRSSLIAIFTIFLSTTAVFSRKPQSSPVVLNCARCWLDSNYLVCQIWFNSNARNSKFFVSVNFETYWKNRAIFTIVGWMVSTCRVSLIGSILADDKIFKHSTHCHPFFIVNCTVVKPKSK